MVCTCGFGTGIDVVGVELIVHIGAPRSIEDYYQEIGRGGRGGEICNCHVIFDSVDLHDHDFLIMQLPDDNYKVIRKFNFLKVDFI